MRVGDDRVLFHHPIFPGPAKPVVPLLIEDQQGLVAQLGEFRAPAGAALDGVVFLDIAHNNNFLPAADLPANGLEHFAEHGSPGVFAAHEAGDVGHAHVLEGQFIAGQHAHAAFALQLVAFKAEIDFFNAPRFGLCAEKLFGAGRSAAEENTLFGVEHSFLPSACWW